MNIQEGGQRTPVKDLKDMAMKMSFDGFEEVRRLRCDVRRLKDHITQLTLENIRLNFELAHEREISKPPIQQLDFLPKEDSAKNLPKKET